MHALLQEMQRALALIDHKRDFNPAPPRLCACRAAVCCAALAGCETGAVVEAIFTRLRTRAGASKPSRSEDLG